MQQFKTFFTNCLGENKSAKRTRMTTAKLVESASELR